MNLVDLYLLFMNPGVPWQGVWAKLFLGCFRREEIFPSVPFEVLLEIFFLVITTKKWLLGRNFIR